MPLVLAKNRRQGVCLFVWKITESEDALSSLLSLRFRNYYAARLEEIHSCKRRREWLASKVLLHTVADIETPLVYNDVGAPQLVADSRNVSISHSNDFVFVAVSDNALGIDVQRYSDKLTRIADAYMNDAECRYIHTVYFPADVPPEMPDIHNAERKRLLVWSAKEAIYKLYGGLSLKSDVTVNIRNVYRKGYTTAVVTTHDYPNASCTSLVVGIKYLFINDLIFVIAENELQPT